MVRTVVFIYDIVQNFVMLASFIVSLFKIKKILANKYLRLFPFYTLVSLVVDSTFYFNKPFGTLEVNLFVVFEFVIFYIFYWNVLDDRKNHRILIGLIVIYLVLCQVIILLYFKTYNLSLKKLLEKRTFVEFMAMDNIFLVIPIIFYFKSLFSLPMKKLSHDSIFLVMSGILFGFSLMIPTDAIYILIKQDKISIFFYSYILNSLGYIFMHLLIIKAYLSLK